MILKYFELNKLNFNVANFLLFHGKNEGYKNEVYLDHLGNPTVGVGHLIRDNEQFVGLTETSTFQEPEDFCDQTLSDPNICSTAELIFDFVSKMEFSLNKSIAICLYT